MEEVLFLKIKKEPPSVCAGYLPERLHLEGDGISRSIRENGEWGTPEQKKLIFWIIIKHISLH